MIDPTSAAPDRPVAEPHAATVQAVLTALAVDPAAGLSEGEATRRIARHGRNALSETKRESWTAVLLRQFRGVLVWLLAGAALVSLLAGEIVDAAAVAAVLLVNAVIGFVTELRSLRSMEALAALSKSRARVRRDGEERLVAADDLALGDIVLLREGDAAPADLRILEAQGLESNESLLTGEPAPVAKTPEPVAADAPLAERASMLYRGATITRGEATAVVAAVGRAAELGRISELVASLEESETPLERRLRLLSGSMVWVALAIAAALFLIGAAQGRDLLLSAKIGIALAVAAVPEGLPIVATITLARGLLRMAARNALVRRLSAVETLGSVTLICTDKTGTLTVNRMTATELVTPDRRLDLRAGLEPDDAARAALTVAGLCARSGSAAEGGVAADPLEAALVEAAAKAGLPREPLLARQPERRLAPFDATTRMMATTHADGDSFLIAVKGAPEAVLAAAVSGPDGAALDAAARRRWEATNQALASEGLRVIALAEKRADREDADPHSGLTLLALIGLADPPRADVPGALAECRAAGVRVVMATGDQAATARAVARQVGVDLDEDGVIEGGRLGDPECWSDAERERIASATVFSRVSPEQKLQLVRLFQSRGEIVAMTGDGVNDAPALRQADIGIAMGARGSEAAREAAEVVLRDDAFPSIVAAMRQGRVILSNIRKFIIYLLSCNASEVMVVAIGALAGLPPPLMPLQILYLNLVTDVFPAFALGFGPGSGREMRHPPAAPDAPLISRRQWLLIGGFGALMTVATLAAFLAALFRFDLSSAQAATVAFTALAAAQILHVFNIADPRSGLLVNEVTRNPFVWGAIAISTALVVAPLLLPALGEPLGFADPGAVGWMLAGGAALTPLLVGQGWRVWRRLAA